MGDFLSGDAARRRWSVLLDHVEAAYREMGELPSDLVGNGYRMQMAERLETQQRLNRALMYRVFGQIADPPDEAAMVPAVKQRLAARLRIPVREVTRRFALAARLCPRRQLTGPALPPALPVVADALASGTLGEDHLRKITAVIDKLPSCTSATDRDDVEAALVRESATHDADFVAELGRGIDALFNPDGHYDEHDRARRRGITLGPQGTDGMSKLSGHVDPETRAYIEAAAAAVRPGRHLPDGRPDGAVEPVADDRTPAQRCHDGIKLGLKAGFASGALGSHRGHPVTVIVRTTLAELDQAAHAVGDPDVSMPAPARTGGDTALPMRDLIRMAADAIHYLAVFDDHTGRPLYLGRQTRIATTDQRIICYTRDGGCTRPDCTARGYHCEVHHAPGWYPDGRTDADALYFACGPDHKLLTDGHWRAAVTAQGRLGWTDGTSPPRVNRVHHPDELLRGGADPPRDQT
ncbi:13E12 repeat family protein [Mycolicibacterium vaccae]|uniref:13E12 repeat family protein n=1 Tax=Mycolicibacterium vaccae TaxID=1810 RepID=UPI0002D7D74C|nr:13E12 repeat family protein [Mycolicibacterium vaccae]ANI37454.1 HNH nuclease [Mycolicibacterium vaccae 95051]MCV7062008.1 HNH endonuclease [Mycolicibacterium vaccae]